MAEYIEREAFKEKYLCCGYLPEMSEETFDEFPTADVAPVVHGRWIVRHKGWGSWVDCSECGTMGSPHWKGCPVCLARMDGDG